MSQNSSDSWNDIPELWGCVRNMSVQDPRYSLASRSQAAVPVTLHEEMHSVDSLLENTARGSVSNRYWIKPGCTETVTTAAFPATSRGYANYTLWEQPCCHGEIGRCLHQLSCQSDHPYFEYSTLYCVNCYFHQKENNSSFKISILTLCLPPPASLHHHNL